MGKFFSVLFLLVVFLISSKSAAANNSFVTIVNPQRIAEYTPDYMASFQAERDEIISRNLPATWPVTYDVLLKKDFVNALKVLPENQELGLFLEINPQIAMDAGVAYNKSDSWHRANSLFLSGYTQTDRKKLIDTYFSRFKKEFGYFPKSVGAWWVDAYSLSYMQEKYGITGVLGMSDQYDLDGYSLWGTWWSVPYYPSKFNAALPAQSAKNKLPVVTQRWAPREPLNGYYAETNLEYKHKSEVTPSLFSLQDYGTLELPDSYFTQLLKTYAIRQPHNEFGHAVIGLEGDLKPNDYTTYYSNRLAIVQNLQNSGDITVLTMRDFSEWYIKTFPNVSPRHVISSANLLETDNKSAVWIQSPFYRVGIISDPKTNESKIIDYRSYNELLSEPYLVSPNKNFSLSINLPFIIDSVILPESSQNTRLGALKSITADMIIFNAGDILINNKSLTFPNNLITLRASKIPEEGIIINDFSLTIPFALKHRLPFPVEPVLIGGIIIIGAVISLFKKRVVMLLFGFVLILGIGSVILLPGSTFYISSTELDGLKVLKQMPAGKVLVYEKDCFDCTYQTKYKPAAMAGKKAYVRQLSEKETDITMSFVTAKNSSDARKILKNKGVTYVYLSKYEDYIESLPYLPQDLNLERVYENANTEIYRVK